jgi:hypothetical protein
MDIWKYTDIIHLVAMLKQGRLYLHPLWRYDDLTEGVPTDTEIELFRHFSDRFYGDQTTFRHTYDAHRHLAAVSCWHKNEQESMAMWKIFSESGKGIAIKSTREKLEKAFSDNPNISVYDIEYVDKSSSITIKGPLPEVSHFMKYKSKAYEYERELRAVYLDLSELVNENIRMSDGSIISRPSIEQSKRKAGIFLPVKLEELFDCIIISPFVRKYEFEVLSDVIGKYKADLKVEHSELHNKLRGN